MNPHWEALTPETRLTFDVCAQLPFIRDFYLAGGTGLALHLGHRFSVDLDFFSERTGTVDREMRTLLKRRFEKPKLRITHDRDATFVAEWRNVGLSFFELDVHPLVERPRQVIGIRLAGVRDIGAMKLSAVFNRASRKDLVDLYFILQNESLDDLFRVAAKKYPNVPSFPHLALRGLAFFDDAEQLPMPEMIDKTPWRTMKKFLEQQALEAGRKKLGKYWD
jgi:predicted nucleotidyltransferase component of viral defense system